VQDALVDVYDDGLLAVLALLAAVDLVGETLDSSRVVQVGPVRVRDLHSKGARHGIGVPARFLATVPNSMACRAPLLRARDSDLLVRLLDVAAELLVDLALELGQVAGLGSKVCVLPAAAHEGHRWRRGRHWKEGESCVTGSAGRWCGGRTWEGEREDAC